MTGGDWGRILARLFLAVLVLGGVYAGVAWWTGRQVPSSVVVEGVSIGGLSPDQAAQRLTTELASKATAPISVELGATGRTITVEPAAAGLALDIEGTLDGLSGFTLNPVKVWSHLTGRVDRPVLVTVDRDRLTATVTELAARVRTAPVDGAVSLTGGKVTTTAAVVGTALSVPDAVRKIAQAWPRVPTVSADVERTDPKVTQAAVDRAVREFATPAMSGPVTLVVGERTAALTPEHLGAAITMTPDAEGALAPSVDKEALRAKVIELTAPFVTPATDARIVLQGDAPVVLPGADGVAVDSTQAADLVVAALTSPDRRVSLPTTVARPALTTEAAQALGVKEIVSSFDSTFPANPDRTTNLTIAARTINGTLVKPGETFSLNKVLGERTAAKGYKEANFISDGVLRKTTGGGVSQISTVIYNLSWFAGVELVEHKPHSFYISRYPAGREATVSWPDLDNKWRNTTDYGILVQMWVSGSQVHGRMWSTKVYDVEAIAGPRTNPRPGTTITDNSTECVPQGSIVPGFDITVKRVIRAGGAVVKTESYTTKYNAEDRVVCTNPNHS